MRGPVQIVARPLIALATLLALAVGFGSSGSPAASALSLTPNWIGLSPSSVPPGRTSASMAYDPATGDMVLFGGDELSGGSGTPLADTWTWDGTTWTEQFPSASPPALYGASLAYDQATGDLVLFGGISSNGDMAETWTWNGLTWTQLLPADSPPARYSASLAYDQATGDLVLFGGLADRTLLADTWIWTGTNWVQQHPATKPAARYAASMSADPATGDLVLFGGYNGGQTALSDTWTWTGTTWTAPDPASSPPGRYGASTAYDPATGDVVLFGGYDGGAVDDSDMWTWNGSTWASLSPTTSPPARRYASMDYDAATGNLLLFGGDPGGSGTPSSLADTWIWGAGGTLAAAPDSAGIILGGSVSDTATVTGNPGVGTPSGTVSFYACGPTATPEPCTSQADPLGGPVPLTPGAGSTATATSPTIVPATAGDWCFAANYSGDSNYAAGADTTTDQCVVVDPVLVTAPASTAITLGNTDTDVATVFGTVAGGVPTGTVTFSACGPTATPAPCTAPTGPLGAPVTLTPGPGDTATATSPVFTPDAVGDWCFTADYSGGGSYAAGSDTTVDGCVSVTPVLSTAPTFPTVDLGNADTDVATLTGNPASGVPTGSVSFYGCGPSVTPEPCTSQADPLGGPVTLTPGPGDTAGATSPPFAPTAVGYWCVAADYSGGGSYPPESDTGSDGCFDVTASAPAFTSAASASAPARQPFSFSVTTSGAPAPAIVGAGLPKWLVLTDNGDGTATLSATKAHKGRHSFTLTATNSAASVTQTFVLTVRKRPAG